MAESDSASELSVDFVVGGFSRTWDDLTEQQRAAAVILGGSESYWPPIGRQWPDWAKMSAEQQQAARALDETIDEDSWPPEIDESDDDSYQGLEFEESEDEDHTFAEPAELAAARAKKSREEEGPDPGAVQAVPVDGRAYTPSALKTIASELKYMAKSDDSTRGWSGGPIGDNVGQWQVEVHNVPHDLPLWKDMQKLGHKSITMHIIFPPDYPFSAPFMRVVRPRFAFRTGHVTLGGSICIELLTNSGWSPLYRLEGVMMHVCSTIYGEPGDPPARLDLSNQRDYGVGEAMEAFQRLLATHGWSHWIKRIA